MKGSSATLIDGQRVAELRRLAGLSQRALAGLMDVAQMTMRRIEENQGHGDLTLRFVNRLAEVLGVEVAVLLPAPAARVRATPDDAAVEAALTDLGRYVPVEELARALGWTLERINAALAALDERLATTGSILKQRRFEYSIGPRRSALTDKQHTHLQRLAINRWSLNIGTALVLREALEGGIDGLWERNQPPWKRLALGTLLKQDLVRMEGPRIVVTDRIRDSLALNTATV
jgi:transcriptional regulator with XRE-family HTH domain